MGNIPRFMQRLNTAYGMYRRYKRNKPGHCFQARYGAKLVAGDEYLLRVTRYIHLNPAKLKGMQAWTSEQKLQQLRTYPWSSYRGYVGKKHAEDIVDYRWLALMERRTAHGNRAAYRAYVESMLDGEDPVLKEAMTAHRYAIGDEQFRADIDDELHEARLAKGVYGDIAWPTGRDRGVDEVIGMVAQQFAVEPDELKRHGRRAGVPKKVAAELCCQFCGKSQRDIGRALGYTGNGSVGKQRAKLRELLGTDPALQRRLTRLQKCLRSE